MLRAEAVRLVVIVVVFGYVTTVVGCASNEDEPRPTTTADAGADSGRTDPLPPVPDFDPSACPPLGDPLPFRVEFVPSNVEIAPGSSAGIEMKIIRRADFKKLVSVGAQNAP